MNFFLIPVTARDNYVMLSAQHHQGMIELTEFCQFFFCQRTGAASFVSKFGVKKLKLLDFLLMGNLVVIFRPYQN